MTLLAKIAIEILQDMGLLEGLLKNQKAHVSDSGGFVSPGGLSFVGRSHQVLGSIPAAIACKRILLDEEIAMAAKKAGADLREMVTVEVRTSSLLPLVSSTHTPRRILTFFAFVA